MCLLLLLATATPTPVFLVALLTLLFLHLLVLLTLRKLGPLMTEHCNRLNLATALRLGTYALAVKMPEMLVQAELPQVLVRLLGHPPVEHALVILQDIGARREALGMIDAILELCGLDAVIARRLMQRARSASWKPAQVWARATCGAKLQRKPTYSA